LATTQVHENLRKHINISRIEKTCNVNVKT